MARFAWTGALALSAALAMAACSKGGGGSSSSSTESLYAQKDDPENLKGLLDTIVKASESGDTKKAAALTRGLIPDKDALAKALKDDAPADFIQSYLDNVSKLPPDDAQVAGLMKRGEADRTAIQVHAATTEEIRENKEGTPAYAEFPGGARKLAENVLRPGVKFYEVEFTKPGEDLGMKYHLFYWDGSQWRMLGPAWRGIK
jgi:hypothetical protein